MTRLMDPDQSVAYRAIVTWRFPEYREHKWRNLDLDKDWPLQRVVKDGFMVKPAAVVTATYGPYATKGVAQGVGRRMANSETVHDDYLNEIVPVPGTFIIQESDLSWREIYTPLL